MIIIEKNNRILRLESGGEAVLCCPIALGKNPIGPKQCEGDGRTPEGRYFLCTKNPHSRYGLSLGISYPNAEDARRGLAAGQIDADCCAALVAAAAARVRPDWQTPLGGLIMIHGEDPTGRRGDWTQGCIALANSDMKQLFARCEMGEAVLILP